MHCSSRGDLCAAAWVSKERSADWNSNRTAPPLSKARHTLSVIWEKMLRCALRTAKQCGVDLALAGFCISLAAAPQQNSTDRAAALLQHGNYAEARRELLRITRENPKSDEAFALLGIAEMQ